MELLDQKMKAEMEKCKKRARAAGLQFQDNTLEYVVTNRDLLELSPKYMIPTLYDYWVQDVEVIRNKWIYEVYPHNPYETAINTRPPISFYNADNADWFNVMIFYHVLGHIDFYQNNVFFRNTWDDDFAGQALADKRLINRIREELGAEKRWVDYVIEFALQIENLVGFYPELKEVEVKDYPEVFGQLSEKMEFYFSRFLKERYETGAIELKFYYDEIERYNRHLRERGQQEAELAFFEDLRFISKFPEFNDVFRKWKEKERKPKPKDIFEHLMENSDFLNKKKNKWMKDVIRVIRQTSLYFQPQIRTKICNEGWASFWHERLYISDERIKTHETEYAKVDAGVTLIPWLGINPYAAGKHLFEFIEDMARRGKLSPEYRFLKGIEERRRYDRGLGEEYAKKVLFEARKYLNDYLLINFLSDEDLQDFVDRYKLFLAGIRPSQDEEKILQKGPFAEIYIKSKSGTRYREALNKMLYHPPNIDYETKSKEGELYLDHIYEGRTLVAKYIPSCLIGLEFFAGHPVKLETTEYEEVEPVHWWYRQWFGIEPEYKKVRVLYTCKDRKVERTVL